MEAPEYKPKLDLSQLTEEEIEQLKAAQKEEDDPDHPSSGNIPRHRHWPQMRFKKGKNIEFETPEYLHRNASAADLGLLDPQNYRASGVIKTRRGEKTTDTFTRLLGRHAKNIKNPLPIFEFAGIEPGVTDVSKFKGEFTGRYWRIDDPQRRVPGGLTLHHGLVEKCNETNSFVFLVVSQIHSTILILNLDGTLFTVGYGYKYTRALDSEKNAISNSSSIFAPLVSLVNLMEGALYTADHMLPLTYHESKLVWIGVFTDEIKSRLEATLRKTNEIIYSLELSHHEEPEITVSNVTKLPLDSTSRYLPAAEYVKIGNNCLSWAKSIIGVDLKCASGRPIDCQGFDPAEVDFFFEEAFVTKKSMDELSSFIEELQRQVEQPSLMKRLTGRGKSRKGKRTNKRKKRTFKNKL